VRAAVVFVIAACGGSDPPPVDAPCTPATLFLNRAGGDYDTGAFDDAAANRSVLLDGPMTLAPYSHDDIAWAATVQCIRAGLAPFSIAITETDPGLVPHVEIVFTTSYWAGPAGTTMVVPGGCRPGHQLEFVFGDALATDVRACQMALIGFAQMTANLSIGGNCRDFLDLSQDCVPDRAFVDETVPCVDQTGQPADCRCGGTTQNTFAAMTAAFPACP
jgi:hypothetical protein